MRNKSLLDTATDQIVEGLETASDAATSGVDTAGDSMSDVADAAVEALAEGAVAIVTSSLVKRLLTNRKFMTAMVVLIVGAVVYKKFIASDDAEPEAVIDDIPNTEMRTPA